VLAVKLGRREPVLEPHDFDALVRVERLNQAGELSLGLANHLAAHDVDRGAAVNQTNLNGATALWSASYTGNTRVAALLIRRGADLVCHHFDYLGGVSGAPVMTSTMMIARSMNRSDSPIVALLESVTRPPRKRMQAHWLRRILFHVVGRRSEKHWLRRILDHVVSRRRTNPASARHQLAADRFLPERIAAFMLPPEE